MEERKAYRIGIDVGGTFTKAVLVDDDTHEIVGRYSTLTTHADPRGVAAGVVEVFRRVLAGSQVAPEDVVFLAHSTTQATNALLEGDVAPVGIVALASGPAAALAAKQSRIEAIELAPGRVLHPGHRFIAGEALDAAAAAEAVKGLQEEGARVIVATSAFGVDDGSDEELIRDVATAHDLPVTCGHEISKLYGLGTRTRTAVINASILPRMIETANMTEASVHEAGIAAPLMIMRGDGGVMAVHEMRHRPAMTMLSGPAASVAGALMHLRISDGIYFEVGGTSTNIGVIRNGRPTVKYARVGGHETYVSSLDVRVLGIAGGSLVRSGEAAIADVGPRSAHIAGLAYAAFASPEVFDGATLELFQPGPGEAADHVAIRGRDGQRYAVTTTCAANALGYARPGMHAFGNPDAARAALAPLAARLGVPVDEAARQILVRATDKVIPVVEQLVAEYGLDRDQALLVGEGGGAGALMPFAAERLGLRHVISPDAEVISSIGVALALVREVVERVIADPGPEELRAIRREARDAVVRLGAAAETVEITIEIDAHSQRVRATAVGASEMRARHRRHIGEGDARAIAAESMGLPVVQTSIVAATDGMRLIRGTVDGRHPLRAVDLEGAIRIQRSDAGVECALASDALALLQARWDETHAEMFLVLGGHVIDLGGILSRDQALAVARTELEGVPGDTTVLLVAARRA
jgi:N-methylhydantoinase A/oxoprolinase/acetone carboxylase beta subunit